MPTKWNPFRKSSSAVASPTVKNGESRDSDEARLGLIVLKDKPSDANRIVDIVALHGLNGHPINTWTWTPDKKGPDAKKPSVNWLEELLPTAIDNARIMSYGYDSTVQFSKSTAHVGTFAEGLLSELMSRRLSEKEKARPIIFICHSLGGIVFKQALVKAHERDRFAELLKKIRGVAFFGTPHRGSKYAKFGDVLASVVKVSAFGVTTNTRLVTDLKDSSETLWQISKSFVDRGKALQIFSFYEKKKMPWLNSLVVEEESAILNQPNETTIPVDGDHTSICRFSKSRDDENRYRVVWTHLKEMVDKISESEVSFSTNLSQEDQRRCLKSLYFKNTETFRNRNPDRVAGTCEWFLQHQDYQRWRTQARSSLLWFSADPGYGKSVLAKFLVEHLRQSKSKDRHPELVCHFFFKGDNDEQRSIVLALRALLHQIFTYNSALLRHASSSFDSMDTAMVEDLDTLWDILVSVLSDQKAPNLICILDGLDELDSGSQRNLLDRLNKLYGQKDLQAQSTFKFLVLSKPENLIKTCLNRNTATIRLRGEDRTHAISKDVKLVVQSHMDEMKAQGVPHDLLAKLQEALFHKADRTFLWTTLMITTLKDAAMDGASGKELKDLVVSNQGIDNVYAVLLSRCTETDRSKTRKLLQIVLAARRPLFLDELNVALAISLHQTTMGEIESELKTSMESYIKATCGHFIRIVGGEVYLAHQTAREFLLQQKKDTRTPQLGPWYRSLSLFECDSVLLRSCISYLFVITVAENANSVTRLRWRLNFSYAKFRWILHYHDDNPKIFQEILQTALHILTRWPKKPDEWSFAHKLIVQWSNWKFALLDKDLKGVPAINIESVASTLDSIIQPLLGDRRVGIHACDPQGNTLLHYAAPRGSIVLVKALLRKGVNASAKNRSSNTPLHILATNSVHIRAPRRGPRPGPTINSTVFEATMTETLIFERPLSETHDIIRLLNIAQADIYAVNDMGLTPSKVARECGHEFLIELLCADEGVVKPKEKDVKSENKHGKPALLFPVGNS